jgi:hypothetical protein
MATRPKIKYGHANYIQQQSVGAVIRNALEIYGKGFWRHSPNLCPAGHSIPDLAGGSTRASSNGFLLDFFFL